MACVTAVMAPQGTGMECSISIWPVMMKARMSKSQCTPPFSPRSYVTPEPYLLFTCSASNTANEQEGAATLTHPVVCRWHAAVPVRVARPGPPALCCYQTGWARPREAARCCDEWIHSAAAWACSAAQPSRGRR